MAGYHRVRSKYWPDMRGASEHAKNLGMYILTCVHRSTEGLYHLPIGYAAEDLELSASVVRKALAELVNREFISYDYDAQVVLIRKALTYPDQVPKSRTQIIGALNALAHVPPTPLRDEFLTLADTYAPRFALAIRDGVEAVDDTHADTHTHTPTHTHG